MARTKRAMALVLLGPVVAFAGAVGYFLVAQRVTPATVRWLAWIFLPLALAGFVAAAAGWRRGAREGRGLPFHALAAAASSVAFALAGLFTAYLFVLSSSLPDAGDARGDLAAARAIEVRDTDGRPASLADFDDGPLVLVFFRGHW